MIATSSQEVVASAPNKSGIPNTRYGSEQMGNLHSQDYQNSECYLEIWKGVDVLNPNQHLVVLFETWWVAIRLQVVSVQDLQCCWSMDLEQQGVQLKYLLLSLKSSSFWVEEA